MVTSNKLLPSKRLNSFVLLCHLTLVLCANSVRADDKCSPPSWVSDEKVLNQPEFYVGTGDGSSLKEAKAQALSELGRNLSAVISSSIETRTDFKDKIGDSYNEEQVKEAVAVVSQLTLRGAKLDRQAKVCERSYALMKIDRKTAEKQLKNQDKLMENIRLALEGKLDRISTDIKSQSKKIDEVIDNQKVIQKKLEETKASIDTMKEKQEKNEIKNGSGSPEDGGVTKIDKKIGDGSMARIGNRVTVHYIGSLWNNSQEGRSFDSSYDRRPFSFNLGMGQVIKGWDEGIPGMRVGGVRRLIIAPEKAYGDKGAGKTIPPNSTLVFDVELVGLR